MERKIGDKFKQKYGDDMFNFLNVKSKHQIEEFKKDIQDFLNEKYPHRKGRLLGSMSKAMDEEPYLKLLRYAKSVNIKVFIAILIEGELGQRIGDVVKIKITQFDFVKGYLYAYNSKSKRNYEIPMSDWVKAEIQDYINYFMHDIMRFDNYLLFPNDFKHHPTKKHLTEHYVNRKVKEYLKVLEHDVIYAKSEDGRDLHLFTSHSLRGRAGSYVYEKSNHNTRLVQKFLDHSPRTNTEVYLRSNNQELEEVIRGDLRRDF